MVTHSITTTPLWGARKDGAVPALTIEELRKAGLCVAQEALVGDPAWKLPYGGDIAKFPILRQCEARQHDGLYFAQTSADWIDAGTTVDQVVPRLEDLASKMGGELVCLTPTKAEMRRKARADDHRLMGSAAN